MIVFVVVAAVVVGAALDQGTRETWGPALHRTNYRDAQVTTGVGVLIPVTAIVVAGAVSLLQAAEIRVSSELERSVLITALATAGYGLLGLLDDVAGAGQSGGFRGHLRALAGGRLTTGLIKWGGGAALAVAIVGLFVGGNLGRLLVDAAVVALAANLGNLLDRRPARTTKAAVVVVVAIAVGAASLDVVAGSLCAVAAAVALAPGELSERHMLGDAGANAVGAAVGLAIVGTAGTGGRNLAAAVLLALNLISEVVSFTRVIDTVAPLRWLDRLGRRA